MIRCLIVDDEPLAIDVLKRYIEQVPGLVLVHSFQNPLEAFVTLQKEKIDLLFLDIQMPALTGLDLIRSLTNPPKIILTTAFRDFAVEGFELEVLDYLVKPVSQPRFLKAINKFYMIEQPQEHTGIKEEPFTFLKVDREMVKLKFSEILYVEGLKNYVRIKTTGKDLIAYYSLGYLEDKLPVKLFKRVHKSFIVNLHRIDKFTVESLQIQGKIIPVGRSYQEQLTPLLQQRAL